MKNVILEKRDGVVEVLDRTPEVEKEMFDKHENNKAHLCWEFCENACANKCKKVADWDMKEIDAYDFVDDGYQIIDDEGKVDKFVVNKCKNYVYSKKVLTEQDKKEAKRARESLRLAYFDTDSLDSTYAKQYADYKAGTITEIKALSADELQMMKRKYDNDIYYKKK